MIEGGSRNPENRGAGAKIKEEFNGSGDSGLSGSNNPRCDTFAIETGG